MEFLTKLYTFLIFIEWPWEENKDANEPLKHIMTKYTEKQTLARYSEGHVRM